MTAQCEVVADTQTCTEDNARKRMTALMYRLRMSKEELQLLSPIEIDVLRVELTDQLDAVEKEEARRDANNSREWWERHPLPQATGPSPSVLAARGQRAVGTRSA